ncbi:DUF5412 family protein [Bacillus horti]|uniref:Uncharacterized protein n=1 Tax=Caldalkalibacillus horti TaxID=77523 RepID=A0ABT9W3P9_9BACI|nr:DUF5412 family protein [Bacillus horti]MDQ0167868.1 hypothetical protein [Bacillus horti]
MNNTLFSILVILGAVFLVITVIVFLLFLIKITIYTFKRNIGFPFKCSFILLSCLLFTSFHYYNLYNNLEYLPEGVINQSVPSPDGLHEITTYHLNSRKSARAEVLNINTGKSKTIYYNYYDYSPYVEWISSDTVVIGRETLNIEKDTYDYRKEQIKPSVLPKQSSYY